MLKHTLLTAQDEFQLAREYKVGMQVEAQFSALATQLGRGITEAEVAQSLEMEVSQMREVLRRMENAKNVLTAANMRLVFHIARYYKFRGVAYPDLVQEGTFGLIKAIQKYDPDRGFRSVAGCLQQGVGACMLMQLMQLAVDCLALLCSTACFL